MSSMKEFMNKYDGQVPTGFVSPEGAFFYSSVLEHYATADEIL